MRKVVIYPYKMGSESAKLLAAELDVKRVFADRDFKPDKDTLVINWGNGYHPRWDGHHFLFLNRPEDVNKAINKVTAFYRFKDGKVAIPDFTEFRDRAQRWIDNYGAWICARTEIEGFDGSGLELVKPGGILPLANLYTRYAPIDREFRVYVFDGQVIDALEKRRHSKTAHPEIRTESNDWVFCKYEYENLDKDIAQNAILAIKSLGLTFGGVDIIKGQDKRCYVLEVNTAPGIAARTVVRFAEAIKKYAVTK